MTGLENEAMAEIDLLGTGLISDGTTDLDGDMTGLDSDMTGRGLILVVREEEGGKSEVDRDVKSVCLRGNG